MNDYPMTGALVPTDEIDPSNNPAVPGWVPAHVIPYSRDDEAGIAFDDGCVLVLFQDVNGDWRPGKWIPVEIARRLHEFVP